MGKCYNSVVVNAPVGEVWAAVRDFHRFDWAGGVIESVEQVGEISGTSIGARRLLNGVFHETLLTLSDLNYLMEYSIDDGPGPVAKDAVSNYVGRLQLYPVTGDDSTFVEWSSTYDALDSAAVGDFCNPIYRALLSKLQEYFA